MRPDLHKFDLKDRHSLSCGAGKGIHSMHEPTNSSFQETMNGVQSLQMMHQWPPASTTNQANALNKRTWGLMWSSLGF